MKIEGIRRGRRDGAVNVTETEVVWTDKRGQPTKSVPLASVQKAVWVKDKALTLKLVQADSVLKLGGFTDPQRSQVTALLEKTSAVVAEDEVATRGWSWGELQTANGETVLRTMSAEGAVGAALMDFANADVSQVTHKMATKELIVTFNKDKDELVGGEVTVSELKFWVADEETLTSAAERTKETADISDLGAPLIKFEEVNFMIPRGKHDIEIYQKQLKLHGRSADFIIKYPDLSKVILLERDDNVSVTVAIGLETPIRIGQTAHPWLLLKFPKEQLPKRSGTMTEKELGDLDLGPDPQTGEDQALYSQLATVIKAFANRGTVIPTKDFKSKSGTKGLHCSVKTTPGDLYFLKKAIIFVDKPVLYIRYDEIVYVEFSNAAGSRGATRYFVMTMKTKDDVHEFENLEKKEWDGLVAFLQEQGVKLRNLDKAKPQVEHDDESLPDDTDEDDEEYEEGASDDEDGDDDDGEDDDDDDEPVRKKARKA